MARKQLILITVAVLFFLLLILFVPFYKEGLFFSLDGSMREKLIPPSINNLVYVWSGFLYLLNQFISVSLIQKGVCITVISFLLVASYFSAPFNKNVSKLFFSGIVTFNPFVYARFLSGQYMVILGYAFFILLFLLSFKKESISKYAMMTLILIALLATSIHYLFISLLFVGFYLISKLLFSRPFSLKNLSPLLVFLLLLAVVMLAVLNPSNVAKFGEFNSQDLFVFISLPDTHLGLLPNLVSLFGFWNEGERQFVSLKQSIVFWPLVTFSWLILTSLGVFSYLKKEQKDSKINAIMTLLFTLFCLLIAVGIQSEFFQPAILYLYEKMSIFFILREPHKIIGVIAVFIAFFSSYYIDTIRFDVSRKFAIIILLLGFIYYPGFIYGFYNEIKLAQYPSGWAKARIFLQQDKSPDRILIFPWHMYMKFRFANNKNIYNLAEIYFDQNKTVSAHNYEIKGLYTHDYSLEQMHIDGLLRISQEGEDLFDDRVRMTIGWGQALIPIDVKYVLLLKESDWRTYRFLDKQKDLKKVFENENVIIYRNMVIQ